MLEIISSISGPSFLLIFSAFSAIIIAIGLYIKKSLDDSLKYDMPPFEKFDAYTITLLKHYGYVDSYVRMVLLGLIAKNLITVSGEPHEGEVTVLTFESNEKLTKLEYSIFQVMRSYESKTFKIKRLDYDEKIKQIISDFKAQATAQLQENNLYRKPETIKLNNLLKYIIIALILFFGGTKLILGILHDKPSFFLGILIVVACLIAQYAFKLYMGPTKLGLQFNAEITKYFQWMKKPMPNQTFYKSNKTINNPIEYGEFVPTLAVGLYGYDTLINVAPLSSFNETYGLSPSRNDSIITDTSMSNSDSDNSSDKSSESTDNESSNGSDADSSSSDSGGGDDGGSDGGGCGGCGGGD